MVDFRYKKMVSTVGEQEIFSTECGIVEKAGLMVVVVDAPNDRQKEPYLNGFRQTQRARRRYTSSNNMG